MMGNRQPEESIMPGQLLMSPQLRLLAAVEEDKENQPGMTKRSNPLNLSLKKSMKKCLYCENGDENKWLSRFTSPYSEQEVADKLTEGLKPVNTEASI